MIAFVRAAEQASKAVKKEIVAGVADGLATMVVVRKLAFNAAMPIEQKRAMVNLIQQVNFDDVPEIKPGENLALGATKLAGRMLLRGTVSTAVQAAGTMCLLKEMGQKGMLG